MANIFNYLEKIINGIKTNTILQIATLVIIIITVSWNVMYSPDEREDHEMALKAKVGLVAKERSFDDEFNALSLNEDDYNALQNDFKLFVCKQREYENLIDGLDTPVNCPKTELLPICKNQDMSECFGEIIYDDSSIYLGEIINDQANGFGVYIQNNISTWGSWTNDSLNGYGYQTDNADRVIYRGEFRESVKHGLGESYGYDPFFYYSGAYLNGYMSGKGLWIETEFIYEGEMLDDNFSGYGEYFDNALVEYNGSFKYGKFHGRGSWKRPGVGVYEGDFKFGLSEGTGTMTYVSGDTYEGSWYRDRRHGLGKYTFADGLSYSGNYSFNLLDDKQAEVTGTDVTCRSGYQLDRQHGYEECYYVSGTYEKTYYENGLPHGLMEWSDTTGTIRYRTYSYGLEDGPAKDVFPDNTTYEYNYKNGRVVGERIEMKNNILISVCNYDDEKVSNCDIKK